MLRAMITPLTLWTIDSTLFDGIELPKRPFTNRGYNDLYLTGWDCDKPTFINNLLMETAELSTIYTDPVFFKYAVTQWAAKEHHVWQSLYETMFFKYNPIWNKDGTRKLSDLEERDLANGLSRTNNLTVTRTDDTTVTEDETSERDLSVAETGSDTVETTPEVVTTVEHTHTNDQETAETKVAAYNESTYQNRDQVTTSRTGSNADQTSHTGSDTEETTYGKTTTTNDDLTAHHTETVTDGSVTDRTTGGFTDTGSDTGTVERTVTETEYGNIGVTMSQQMIEAERELVKLNIYDYIIESFKQRFCILLY